MAKKSVVMEDKELGLPEVAALIPDLTGLEGEELEEAATLALGKAKTKEDVTQVWKAFYGTIGHRKLGRILVGSSK